MGFRIWTNHEIQVGCPDIVIVDSERKKAIIIDITLSRDATEKRKIIWKKTRCSTRDTTDIECNDE